MSTKLIVHKFESGINFKSLRVTIDDDNNEPTKYSEWAEGEIYQIKKKAEKSRLIMKLVSGEEVNLFNLDACAKSVENLEIFNEKQAPFDSRKQYSVSVNSSNISSISNLRNKDASASKNYDSMQKFYIWKKNAGRTSINSVFDSISPLEYSLERVKENNARIMENILLLNRTLDFAKKQEMLEDSCPKTMKSFPCSTCGKCFVYETGLKRHHAMRHAVIEPLPRWQDVWTCVECFQVWPRKDVAVEHAKKCSKDDNVDLNNNVREIKTSSLLQCEFCEKVYTSIPRLLKHTKIHTTVNNYECNSCQLAFTSYKEAEHHWIACGWLKLCYHFSLPKLLLCNACDRKFRNYEQLYNHRYKSGHFITKTHNQTNVNKSLGILVYQCEICAMWFPFISTLLTHRNQTHPLCDAAIQFKLSQNLFSHDRQSNNNQTNNMEEVINVM